MIQLQSNKQLFDYLVLLSAELKSKGELQVADNVSLASRFIVGSSSEFLHEAQEVLRQVRAKCTSVLSSTQVADISSIIEQIEDAFRKVGGA